MPTGGNNYSVLLKATIQKITQAEIDAQTKGLNLNLNVKSSGKGQQDLNTLVGKYQNQLDSIRLSHLDAYKNDEVIAMDSSVQNLVTTMNGSAKTTGIVQVEMGKLKNKVKEVENGFDTAKSHTDDFTTSLVKNIKKVAQWAIATTAIYGSLRQIKEGVQYITDLNTEMTNAQIVTGMTDTQINRLATSYTQLAKELGATTLEVAEGNLAWLRQGKTAAESAQLLKSSVMMAKLANMDQAESTEVLTAIINGYKLSLEEVMPTIDSLVSLDNQFASSVSRQNC
jgi:hypothetical protein